MLLIQSIKLRYFYDITYLNLQDYHYTTKSDNNHIELIYWTTRPIVPISFIEYLYANRTFKLEAGGAGRDGFHAGIIMWSVCSVGIASIRCSSCREICASFSRNRSRNLP